MRFLDGLGRSPLFEEADKGGTGAGEGGGTGAGTGTGDGAKPAGDPPAVDAKALQAEIERLRAETAEQQNAIRYWHEQAKGTGGSKKDEAVKQDDGATEEDLIEVASRGGVRAVAQLLKKQGFVSRDEVDAITNAKAQQITTENELASRYPDLKDEKSEFFKETARHYAGLVKDGVPKHVAMKLAAQQAELDGINTGKRKSAAQLDAERKQAEKEEREARARAQAPDRSRGRQQDAEEDDGNLDDFQAYICSVMDVDPEKYKKRAKEGVKVGGHK